MTRVQVCGFRSAEPLIAAVDAGADAVALVFVPSARRCVTVDEARAVLDEVRASGRALPTLVGLFADQPLDEVQRTVASVGLDEVQLCGGEGVEYASQLGVPVSKVISIDGDVPVAAQMPRIMVLQQRHALAGHRVVLDAQVPGEYGGTGQQFDWDLAADLAGAFEMSLAGGLSVDNVQEAVERVRPWGVDVSSGVETDGEKDPAKVRAFVESVRAVDGRRKKGGLARLLGRR
ncbi:MAG: phosphoribosylanthranilate isomerase [Chloroflexota bacterium]|nr:phosphoribosylanthranilate isomerase [Chloroflexota bacterium]MDE2886308.1 phosphoribosylanthranilate isomerase [Chloroflexota bacterium]